MFLILFVIIINLIYLPLSATITEINELSSLKKTIQSLDKNSVVLLDIDYTVIAPCDAALLPCGHHLRKKYLHNLDLKRREYLQSIIALESHEKLMDDTFLEIIKHLREKGICVYGLTALETGRYGKIESLEEWRLMVLDKLGVKFSSFPGLVDKNIIRLDMLSQYNGNYPIFKNGVFFTNRQPKGQVFTACMNLLNFKPKKVVFVDDALEYLKSVEQAAKDLDIEFIGFHYRAAGNLHPDFDEELGQFQFQYLLENERWLTDKEAQAIRK